ncbi:O-antigen ligase family protein [Actibacterium mucosum]|nr:O-antigen ligase family protein [Actibacterium mucosum]
MQYRRTSGTRIHVPTLGLFLVAFIAMLHNFAGVFAAVAYAFYLGELRNGTLKISGLAGAFWIVACVAFARLILPSSIPVVPQVEEVVRFASFALFAAAITRLSADRLLSVLAAILFLSLALFPVSEATGLFSRPDASGVNRFSALMPHANHLGYMSAIIAVALLYLRLRGFSQGKLWFATILAACLLVVISRSSGALLVSVLGVAVLPISLKPTPKRMLLTLVLFGVLFALSTTSQAQFALEKILITDFSHALAKASSYTFGNQGSSFAWRISYWYALLDTLFESGTYAILFGEGGAAGTKDQAVYFFMVKDPHSDLVKATIEYGVIGFSVIFSTLLYVSWRIGATFIGPVVLIGPMLTGNTLASVTVIFPILITLTMLNKFAKGQIGET